MAERLNNVPNFPDSAPIHKLSIDVLWNIFEMNTDIFAPRDTRSSRTRRTHPIDVLRQTSQVCRFWRKMILTTPALWGQVIDLDHLRRFGNRWVQEVVERAADAPQLCIKGTREWEKKAELCALFVEMLGQRWSKIQKLKISITNPLESKSNTNPWEPLRQPAPRLEIFDISFNYSDSKKLKKEGPPLFADHAPVLRVFKLSATPKVRITLQARWLGHLTTLALPGSFPATDILDALADMPLIETLNIKSILEGELGGVGQRRTVSLPCLKQLTIAGTFTASFLLVKFIIPAAICSLRLDVRDKNHRGIRSTTIREIGNFLISRYVQNHYVRCQAPFVIENLAITEKRINIILVPPKSARSCLNLTIRSDSNVSGPMSSHLLAPLLESCQFTQIDQFYFVHEYCLNNSIEKGVSAALKVIFFTIPHILDMDASQDALELISLLPFDKQLTQIHTLSIHEDMMSLRLDSEEVILCFFCRQLGDKKPVRTLMLNSLDSDWSFLEIVTGLEVSWPGGKYVCGSGKPEKLEFGIF